MILPHPFSRGIFIYGDPIYVKPDSSAQQMEKQRQQLEQALNRITAEADNHFNK